ncbi:MAG: ATP-binding protein [Clostridia bacterium]|jgi:DNA replication protein DnaC
MRNVLIQEILQEYDAYRDYSRRLLEEKRRELFARIPELEEIENKINALMLEQARKVLQQPDQAEAIIADTDKKLLSLKVRERELLQTHGYSPEELEPQYRCPKCKDTGFVGEPVREKCSCLTQQLLHRAYKLSNIHELESQNFDTYDPNVFPDEALPGRKISQRAYMEKIKERCVRFAGDFPATEKLNMVFSGKTGLGKTFLANCIAKAVLDRGFTVLRLTSYKLFDVLLRYHTDIMRNDEGRVDYLFQVDLLIIDDLGTEPTLNNVSMEYLFTIINERIQQRKHTLISTNLSPKELALRYTDRIFSRILDTSNTSIIRFIGRDIRLSK